jgi:5'-nucleotidase
MKQIPLILITNDDGITAPGIGALVSVASKLGEVVVVAPDSPQSAQGHAITIHNLLRLKKVKVFEGIESWECSGTPVDCVKLAKHVALKGRNIDLCLSGINHGANSSINIIYSGTMSAAMEASLEGIDSIGFSLLDHRLDADFEQGKPWIEQIIRYVLEHKLKNGKLLNVNIPKLLTSDIKGIKICHQAKGYWAEEFQEGKDPMGHPYYWLAGKFFNQDESPDADVNALDQGFISIVPSMHDLTDYKAIKPLEGLENVHFSNIAP